jgi:hypothetical protein
LSETLVIPARFNGPPDSGHGGYSCGSIATLVDAPVVEVTLRVPPPLERPLAVSRADGGVEVRDGETLVAEGRPAELELEVPEPVTLEQAIAGNVEGHRRWELAHPFPTCIVCGPEREKTDGSELYAANWTPAPWLAGGDGRVRPEAVWAALDCPSSFPVANEGGDPPIVLARLTASLEGAVLAGLPHILVSWPLAIDGRKRRAGVALFTADGRLMARARALWIELQRP